VSVEAVARMRKRGIRVLPGGDYGFPVTPHGTYARDLWVFVKILGFSPMETLVAATKLGGEIMGQPGELGVVKAGRWPTCSWWTATPRRHRNSSG
jgi:imidazolonepropionase-like amidohydrolase